MKTTPEPAGKPTYLSLPHIERVGSAPAGLGAVSEDQMKSTVQHTPGPWELEQEVWPRNINPDPDAASRRIIRHGDDKIITVIMGRYDNMEDAANAHLIAAAPELLEALKAIIETLNTPGHTYCHAPTCSLCRACEVVAKVEGRSL